MHATRYAVLCYRQEPSPLYQPVSLRAAPLVSICCHILISTDVPSKALAPYAAALVILEPAGLLFVALGVSGSPVTGRPTVAVVIAATVYVQFIALLGTEARPCTSISCAAPDPKVSKVPPSPSEPWTIELLRMVSTASLSPFATEKSSILS